MKVDELEKLFVGIKRKKMLFLPTPFHKLENLSRKYGVGIYMKRDDLTGPSVYGGNKTRKLEFILGEALEKGIEYFISVGGYQTNSGMELAVCCRKCGVKPILYLCDVIRQGTPNEYKGNLLLNKILGCEMHYVERMSGEEIHHLIGRCQELSEERKKELERSK